MLWYSSNNDCWFSDSKVIVIIVNHYIFKIAFALGLKNALTQDYNNIVKCFLIKLRAKLYIVPFTYSSSIQNLSQIYKHSHTHTLAHIHIYTSKFHKNYTVLQKETAKPIKSYALKKKRFSHSILEHCCLADDSSCPMNFILPSTNTSLINETLLSDWTKACVYAYGTHGTLQSFLIFTYLKLKSNT